MSFNFEEVSQEELKLFWYKVIDNLDCLSYEDVYYLKGYCDCVYGTHYSYELSLNFKNVLEGKLK